MDEERHFNNRASAVHTYPSCNITKWISYSCWWVHSCNFTTADSACSLEHSHHFLFFFCNNRPLTLCTRRWDVIDYNGRDSMFPDKHANRFICDLWTILWPAKNITVTHNLILINNFNFRDTLEQCWDNSFFQSFCIGRQEGERVVGRERTLLIINFKIKSIDIIHKYILFKLLRHSTNLKF